MFLSSAVRKDSNGVRHIPSVQRWTPGSPPACAHGHVSYVAQCATTQCREAVGRTYPVVVKKGLENTDRVRGFI
ncbi:hypothetical protein [Cod iridovirus]|uniref:Uncharacterized protein n=2 Tax=Frog virus 3 TaxID=10493 RepID=A0A1B2IUA6_FRG3V|nr:hypothetical protein BGV90_gp030 [Ranavirus maximus]ANZ57057.1 hypothetical protein [Cod iridovirus]ANZ57155.1 hypothetical protein [Ranavirus maximus]